jgi:hypothetical protein
MPNGNRTGPSGDGPRAGRGMGICPGFGQLGNANSGFERGCGMGLGRGNRMGRGLGRGFARIGPLGSNSVKVPSNATGNTGQELEELRQQADVLQNNLTVIKDRIEKLTK